MKSIEQLLELSSNPYYVLTDDEKLRLEAFLYKKSEQQRRLKTSSNELDKNTPAIVRHMNILHPETGEIPTE